jgi:hypothetical protein
MFLGLALTSVWYEWASTGRWHPLGSYTPKIAYLYLAFLLAEMFKTIFKHKGLSGLHHQYSADGAFGLVSVLLISAGYPTSFADLLLGPMFLVAVSVSILLAEWAVIRPASILFVGLSRTISDLGFQRRLQRQCRSDSFWMLTRRFSSEISEAHRIGFAARTDLLQRMAVVLLRRKPEHDAEPHIISFDWRIVGGLFMFNLLFPLAAGWAAWLTF